MIKEIIQSSFNLTNQEIELIKLSKENIAYYMTDNKLILFIPQQEIKITYTDNNIQAPFFERYCKNCTYYKINVQKTYPKIKDYIDPTFFNFFPRLNTEDESYIKKVLKSNPNLYILFKDTYIKDLEEYKKFQDICDSGYSVYKSGKCFNENLIKDLSYDNVLDYKCLPHVISKKINTNSVFIYYYHQEHNKYYPYVLPNVHPSGLICFGYNDANKISSSNLENLPAKLFNFFWSTNFNSDLAKYVNYNQNLGDYFRLCQNPDFFEKYIENSNFNPFID